MRRAAHGTIYDGLRESFAKNGAWKSPSPQSERPIIDSAVHAQMDSSGIGQAATMGRASNTYTGGGLTPQVYTTTPAGPNSPEHLADAGVAVNARAAYPGRGIEPRRSSPLATRR